MPAPPPPAPAAPFAFATRFFVPFCNSCGCSSPRAAAASLGPGDGVDDFGTGDAPNAGDGDEDFLDFAAFGAAGVPGSAALDAFGLDDDAEDDARES